MRGSVRLCCEFVRMNRITLPQHCMKWPSAMRQEQGREIRYMTICA